MSDKRCETCDYWKGAERNSFGVLWGECSVLGGQRYYVHTEEEQLTVRNEFGCWLHKDRPAGPFSVPSDARAPTIQYRDGDAILLAMGTKELVKWLNRMLAERPAQ